MVSGSGWFRRSLPMQRGEDGAHLLEAEGDFASLFFAGVGDHGEVDGVDFEPGRLDGFRRKTKGYRQQRGDERDEANAGHGPVEGDISRKCYHEDGERALLRRRQGKAKPRSSGAFVKLSVPDYQARLPSNLKVIYGAECERELARAVRLWHLGGLTRLGSQALQDQLPGKTVGVRGVETFKELLPGRIG